ncbi:MAG: hypothetical protein QNJ77_08965 [Acidimicrobiia bacterium]|nr:hypothetical protein [Acidimicrobiia bacterium]
MDDTQTRTDSGGLDDSSTGDVHPADTLRELDPADAPQYAEEHAARLAAELEGSDASQPEPVQLVADLDPTNGDETR